MLNYKKVIPSTQSGIWKFYDWVDDDGSNPIEKWLAGESEEVQMTFNSVLKEAGKRRNYLDWPCFRHKMKGKPGAEGVNELGFKAQGRQYRLLVKFDGELQTVILCGCFHKGDKWTPADALETTVKRAKALAQGRAVDMNERSKMISKLIKGRDSRESYIRSKLSVLLPAQIRSLRLRREMKQAELGAEAEMKQGRISSLERIGVASFSIGTLIRLASAFRVGLVVKFVPMSEMLAWENSFMPDEFDVVPVERDTAFINYESVQAESPICTHSWTKMVHRRTFSYPGQVETNNGLATPIEYREVPTIEPYVTQFLGMGVGYPSTAKVGY